MNFSPLMIFQTPKKVLGNPPSTHIFSQILSDEWLFSDLTLFLVLYWFWSSVFYFFVQFHLEFEMPYLHVIILPNFERNDTFQMFMFHINALTNLIDQAVISITSSSSRSIISNSSKHRKIYSFRNEIYIQGYPYRFGYFYPPIYSREGIEDRICQKQTKIWVFDENKFYPNCFEFKLSEGKKNIRYWSDYRCVEITLLFRLSDYHFTTFHNTIPDLYVYHKTTKPSNE